MKRMSLPAMPVVWPHVFAVWQAAFTEHGGVLPEPLLYAAHIHIDDTQVARMYAYTRAYTWWPADTSLHEQVALQDTALRRPTEVSAFEAMQWCVSAGEVTTAALLTTCDTVEAVAGVLIAASIHHRVRVMPCDMWPPYRVIQDLEYGAWQAAGIEPGAQWHHKARTTLPYFEGYGTTACVTVDAFVTMLGREHAEVFRRFRPVQFVFGAGDA